MADPKDDEVNEEEIKGILDQIVDAEDEDEDEDEDEEEEEEEEEDQPFEERVNDMSRSELIKLVMQLYKDDKVDESDL